MFDKSTQCYTEQDIELDNAVAMNKVPPFPEVLDGDNQVNLLIRMVVLFESSISKKSLCTTDIVDLYPNIYDSPVELVYF